MMIFEKVHDEGPESLVELSIRFIVNHLYTIAEFVPIAAPLRLKDGVVLPVELWEKIIKIYQEEGIIDDNILSLFRNKSKARLKRIKLHASILSDEGMRIIMNQQPDEVELIDCDALTEESLAIINRNSVNLTALSIGWRTNIFPQVKCKRGAGPLIHAPKLKKLELRRQDALNHSYLKLSSFEHLVHLDLSECTVSKTLNCLMGLKKISSLVLYNVRSVQDSVNVICSLRTLRHLDVSQSNSKFGKYEYPNCILEKFAKSLPQLTSLDISGTNLAGPGMVTRVRFRSGILSDIPGLASRVNNPLHFLGLYGTLYGACRRRNIPALSVSGDKNETQIITAAVTYMDRPETLKRVLNEMFQLFRSDNVNNVQQIDLALSVILKAMNNYLQEQNIQISGSATLFYMVRIKDSRRSIVMKMKRRIVTALLNAMEEHSGYEIIMRNCCLTLHQFKMPLDVAFVYKRVVTILLHGVTKHEDAFVQRVVISLLNSLACQADDNQRKLLGDQGVIAKMLDLIEDRLNRHYADDVLEVAWSAMWNVSDEAPANSRRFLDSKGMQYFADCYKMFPEKYELVRNMIGLLGNVAEVGSLRPRLMTEEFLSVVYDLLDFRGEDIEISYNAAGVAAHMASDGEEKWTINKPSRKDVLMRLSASVERWNIKKERNINYRTFEAILALLLAYHTPECQHWAVWALANLTTVYPNVNASDYHAPGVATVNATKICLRLLEMTAARAAAPNDLDELRMWLNAAVSACQIITMAPCKHYFYKIPASDYCNLLENEGGETVLCNLIIDSQPYERIKELARIVLENCRNKNKVQGKEKKASVPLQ